MKPWRWPPNFSPLWLADGADLQPARIRSLSNTAFHRLSRRAKLRQDKLLGQDHHLTRFFVRHRCWPPQGEKPFCVREPPQIELRAAKVRLQPLGILHVSDLPGAFLDRKLVQRKRSGLVLYLQIPLIDPHRDILSCQPPLPIEAPVLKADEAVAINLAGELCGVQRSRENLFGEGPAQHSPQHL